MSDPANPQSEVVSDTSSEISEKSISGFASKLEKLEAKEKSLAAAAKENSAVESLVNSIKPKLENLNESIESGYSNADPSKFLEGY